MNFLHKSLNLLFNLILSLLIAALVTIAFHFYEKEQLHQEALSFINISMLDLFTDWRVANLTPYISKEFQQAFTQQPRQEFLHIGEQLGELYFYYGATGTIERFKQSWWHYSAQYTARAVFQYGELITHITLVKQKNQWYIGKLSYEYLPIPAQNFQHRLQHV